MEQKNELLITNKSELADKVKEAQQEIGEFFGQAMGNFFNNMATQSQYKNVAIFVDYDNVYWTLMNNYQHNPDHDDPEKNLFEKLWAKYGVDNVRTFKAYADFDRIETELTSLQKKRVQIRHVYSRGKDDKSKKNSSDIELCIDAIESTYKDEKISCYVIVTADSDMIPLLSRLMYKGKRVELYYVPDGVSKYIDITTYAHYSQNLLELLNVEIKRYNIQDYIIPALEFIQQWWNHNKEKDDRFLGAGWLVEKFEKIFSLPSTYASKLLDELQIQDYVHQVNKKFKGEMKPSLALTEKGEKYLSVAMTEVAASSD
ncbi:NYN domain-containing protein [Anoxybacteroides rupiense]|uniref:NYN domain-containing protein n=1 Tax=Anoxybacteroides rupiense TaxID=311460 RepID=UPI00366DD8BC